MKTRPGRPLKAANAKREMLLQIRLDQSEKATFVEAAEVAGVATSTWVRERLRRAAVRELEEAGRKVPFLNNLTPS
jgi:hypothetical protein